MGKWVVTPRPWYDVSVLNCSLCGKMLPGKIWSVDIAGQERIFCDPDCESVYRQYWLPRYDANADGQAHAPLSQRVELQPGPPTERHIEEDAPAQAALQGSEDTWRKA